MFNPTTHKKMTAEEAVITMIKDYIWGPVLGLVAWGWKSTHKRIDDAKDYSDGHKTELKGYIDKEINTVCAEVTRQRDISAKIFDRLDEAAERATTRHMELLRTLHEGLSGKVDK